jgi:ECF sigma factor
MFMAPDRVEITRLLRQWGTGDRQGEDRLFELLLADLRKIAGRCFCGERPGHTLLDAAPPDLLRELDRQPDLADFSQDPRFKQLVGKNQNGGK